MLRTILTPAALCAWLALAPAFAQEAAPPADPAAAPAAEAPAEVPVDPVVERGKYLAQIGNCYSCHTHHGGEPFAGGLPFKTPYGFLGDIYSTNITPDPETGIGNWTEEQFVRAMHEGVSANGSQLLPAFPYTDFTLVSEEDVKAIFAYLKTVKPVKYTPPANGFLFNMRFGVIFWKMLFFTEGRFTPDPAQTEEWNRGKYLTEGLGHCGACHTPRNIFLAEKESLALSGGTQQDLVEPGKYRTWSAANLTQAEAGLAKWPVGEIKKYLKTGHNRFAGIFGPMNEVVINSLQHLTDEDAQAMAVYIKSLPALNESPKITLTDAQREAGQKLYDEHCEECHLSSGRGGMLKAPPVAGSPIVQAAHPASLINIILYGAQVGKGGPAPFGAWEDMKSFRDKMTDEEIATLSTFLRGHFENRGGVVTASQVAKQR